MKLPEPVAYMDVLGTIFHKVEHELSTDIKLYSEAQVRETFEPVLKQALGELERAEQIMLRECGIGVINVNTIAAIKTHLGQA